MKGYPNNHCELYWRSVEDEIPEVDKHVLVMTDYGDVDIGFLKGNENDGYAFYDPYLDCSFLSLELIVKAWMPLPTEVFDE